MAPLIQQGDLLIVEPARFYDLRVGDVVAHGTAGLEVEDTLTTHRVVKTVRSRDHSYLLTRDDASGWGGRGVPVYPEQVYGRAVKIEKPGEVVDLDNWRVRLLNSMKVRLMRGMSMIKAAFRSCGELHPALKRWMTQLRDLLTRNSASLQAQRVGIQPSTDADPTLNEDAGPHDDHRLPCWLSRSNVLPPQSQQHPDGSFKSTYQKEGDVILGQIGRDIVLVPICNDLADMERVFTLNESASRVWDLIDATRSVEEIRDLMIREFDVAPGVAQGDLASLLDQLQEIGAIHPHEETSSG